MTKLPLNNNSMTIEEGVFTKDDVYFMHWMITSTSKIALHMEVILVLYLPWMLLACLKMLRPLLILVDFVHIDYQVLFEKSGG